MNKERRIFVVGIVVLALVNCGIVLVEQNSDIVGIHTRPYQTRIFFHHDNNTPEYIRFNIYDKEGRFMEVATSYRYRNDSYQAVDMMIWHTKDGIVGSNITALDPRSDYEQMFSFIVRGDWIEVKEESSGWTPQFYQEYDFSAHAIISEDPWVVIENRLIVIVALGSFWEPVLFYPDEIGDILLANLVAIDLFIAYLLFAPDIEHWIWKKERKRELK